MKKKIYIVDDDHDILESMQDLLEMEGYDVTVISKGRELFTILEEAHPHLILLDLLLSGEDGSTICSALKDQETTQNIPIMLMSAHPTAKNQAMEAGANDFIAKPFDADEMLHKVATLVK